MTFNQTIATGQQEQTLTAQQQKRLYSIFQGIERREYPRWNGWAIIQEYRELDIKPQDIWDLRLECCVQNLHFLIEIAEDYGITLQ